MTSYILSIEDVVMSVFAARLTCRVRNRFLSYRYIDEVASRALEILKNRGIETRLNFSRDKTEYMLIQYSDFFSETFRCGPGIILSENKTVDDLFKLCGYLPVDVLEVLYNIALTDIDDDVDDSAYLIARKPTSKEQAKEIFEQIQEEKERGIVW